MLDRILKERRQVRTRKRRQGFVLQQGWSLQGVVEEAQSMKSLSSERFRTCLYTHSFIPSSMHPSTYHSIYFFLTLKIVFIYFWPRRVFVAAQAFLWLWSCGEGPPL